MQCYFKWSNVQIAVKLSENFSHFIDSENCKILEFFNEFSEFY